MPNGVSELDGIVILDELGHVTIDNEVGDVDSETRSALCRWLEGSHKRECLSDQFSCLRKYFDDLGVVGRGVSVSSELHPLFRVGEKSFRWVRGNFVANLGELSCLTARRRWLYNVALSDSSWSIFVQFCKECDLVCLCVVRNCCRVELCFLELQSNRKRNNNGSIPLHKGAFTDDVDYNLYGNILQRVDLGPTNSEEKVVYALDLSSFVNVIFTRCCVNLEVIAA